MHGWRGGGGSVVAAGFDAKVGETRGRDFVSPHEREVDSDTSLSASSLRTR